MDLVCIDRFAEYLKKQTIKNLVMQVFYAKDIEYAHRVSEKIIALFESKKSNTMSYKSLFNEIATRNQSFTVELRNRIPVGGGMDDQFVALVSPDGETHFNFLIPSMDGNPESEIIEPFEALVVLNIEDPDTVEFVNEAIKEGRFNDAYEYIADRNQEEQPIAQIERDDRYIRGNSNLHEGPAHDTLDLLNSLHNLVAQIESLN